MFSIKWSRPKLVVDNRPDIELVSICDDHTPPDQLRGYFVPAAKMTGPKPLVVVFHGMGGEAKSQYMRSMAERLTQAGYPALLWNHRGAGRSAQTCKRLHHPGFTDDIRRLAQYLTEERPSWSQNGLVCVGFSLGASLMLKYFAASGVESAFEAGISISAPIDMEITSKNLKTGKNRIFDAYLLHKQREELLRENAELSKQERDAVKTARSVWELDDTFTGPRLGYDGAAEFYQDNSAIHSIGQIRKPMLLLHAEDDPVVDPDVFAAVEWQANEWLYPALVDSGGHTGFYDQNGNRWHEQATIAFLDQMI